MRHLSFAFILAVAMLVTAHADDVTVDGWGFSFRAPAGWKHQQDATGALLGHDTIAGLIIVLPHTQPGLSQVKAQMGEGLNEQGLRLALDGELRSFGKQGITGDYRGTFQSETVKARAFGTTSTNSIGAYVIAVTTPDKLGKELIGAAEAIAGSVNILKVDASDVTRQFVGTWVAISQYGQTTVTLAANGEYASSAESSHSGVFRDSGGYQSGSWGAGGQTNKRGRWSARGTREAGVLEFVTPSGEKQTSEYKVHVEKGKTYWNEFYIGGKLYGRSGR